ncbi:MAG: bifunctional 2-polyprenyl-6-hydroxyphenol methylase/3-demethylubiquinol 3-O-methyltransferase UbiG [Gammaproteobacteria bacterium]|nr:bifunctional 2-polyprenyl-6-hydroxyphenol methylase/3-demethylubiquinol 3-O-methyltransferase UbiG [Gammaproteobacteria bacterium]
MPDISQENIDQAEIAKFEAMAERWWNPQGEFKPLHDLNPLRLNYIKQRAGLRNKTVLDVGCGGGILSESMANEGADVTAIDMAEGPLAIAASHAKKSGVDITYRRATVEQLSNEQAGAFDIVTCMEMLEHVPSPSSVIRACARLTKPGGDVFFSTINRNPKAFLLAIVGAEYVLNLLPKGTHEYARFIKPSELDTWAGETGLNLSNLTGIHYNPLTQRYSIGGNVDVNYLIHFQRTDY